MNARLRGFRLQGASTLVKAMCPSGSTPRSRASAPAAKHAQVQTAAGAYTVEGVQKYDPVDAVGGGQRST